MLMGGMIHNQFWNQDRVVMQIFGPTQAQYKTVANFE